jgi:hypothetical protein
VAKGGKDSDEDDDKKKEKKSGGVVLGAALLAVVVAAGVGGLPGEPERAQRITQATGAARAGNADQAWQLMGYLAGRQRIERNVSCVALSSGAVRDIFAQTPCRSMQRALFVVADAGENRAVISVVWVRMPTAGAASRLRAAEDRAGSGDVVPIASRNVGLAPVTFTATHYRAIQSGALLVIAETEPASGHMDGDLLDDLAEVAAHLRTP